MIVGADHIQFAVSDLQLGAKAFAGLGYEISFTQDNFLSARQSYRCFLQQEKSMLYLKARDGSVPVELITGSQVHERNIFTTYYPVANAELPGSHAMAPVVSELNGSGKCLYAPVLDSCYLLATVGDSPVLDSIVVLVSDIEASKRFWSEGLGFQIQSEDKNGARLFWPGTLICKSISLTLLATAETTEQPEFVDRVGTVLLSFVSTDIETDGGRIKCFTKGELSPLMEFGINNKRIAASMHLGPSNELIELIQIAR